MLDSRPRGCGFEPYRGHHFVSLSKNIIPSLVLVQPRKTQPYITERLLMGPKESNQTKNNNTLLYNVIANKDMIKMSISCDLSNLFHMLYCTLMLMLGKRRSSSRSTLSATLSGHLVCVICNSKSFHSPIMIVHTLKMCRFYEGKNIFSFLGVLIF